MEFSRIFKSLRKENGFTAREISSKLNLSINIIYDWEKERCEPSYTALCKLADIFDVSVDYLLGRESDYVGTPPKTGSLSERRLSEQEERLLKSFNQLDERSKMRLIEDAEYFARKVKV